jgi:hypothetical protein
MRDGEGNVKIFCFQCVACISNILVYGQVAYDQGELLILNLTKWRSDPLEWAEL